MLYFEFAFDPGSSAKSRDIIQEKKKGVLIHPIFDNWNNNGA